MDEPRPKPNVHATIPTRSPIPSSCRARRSRPIDPRHSGPSEDATADIVERQKDAKTGRAPEDAPDY